MTIAETEANAIRDALLAAAREKLRAHLDAEGDEESTATTEVKQFLERLETTG